MKSKKILFSTVALVATFVLSITTIVAWFIWTDRAANSYFTYVGDGSLNVNLYIGQDSNKDGLLDEVFGLNPNTALREEIIQKQYYEAVKDTTESDTNTHSDCIEGSVLTFKMVVENKSQNQLSYDIAMNFSNIERYFFDYLGYFVQYGYLPDNSSHAQYVEFNELLGENTARVMFQVNDITANVYGNAIGAEGGTLNFTNGYNTLLRTSDSQKSVDTGAQLITSVSSLPSDTMDGSVDNYLWNVSREEQFVSGVAVNPGELLEINFGLYCRRISDAYEGYGAYAPNYYPIAEEYVASFYEGQPSPPSEADRALLARQYTDAMVTKEQEYLFTDDDTGVEKKLTFSIAKMFVTATSK